MDKNEALKLLKSREVATFNTYRTKHPAWIPDFSGENLSTIDFVGSSGPGVNLERANLTGTKMPTRQDYFKINGVKVSLKGAIIDATTSGQSLDFLKSLGRTIRYSQTTRRSSKSNTHIY